MGADRNSTTEHVDFRSLSPTGELEVLHARFVSHHFAAHSHENWAIGGVLRGAKDLAIKGEQAKQFSKGDLVIIPPGRPHAGRVVGGEGCEYVMLYVSPHAAESWFDEVGWNNAYFSDETRSDPDFVMRLSRLIKAVFDQHTVNVSRFHLDVEVFEIIETLIQRHASPKVLRTSTHGTFDIRLKRAVDFLHENCCEDISLQSLAQHAGMSAFHLCRRFSESFGLPPHRFQLVIRLQRAKELLQAGGKLADVAAATGFADQSHFGRHFKSCYGFTPGLIGSAF